MEYKNKAILQYGKDGAWIDFYCILIANGYEVTAKVIDGDEIVITWGDKA